MSLQNLVGISLETIDPSARGHPGEILRLRFAPRRMTGAEKPSAHHTTRHPARSRRISIAFTDDSFPIIHRLEATGSQKGEYLPHNLFFNE